MSLAVLIPVSCPRSFNIISSWWTIIEFCNGCVHTQTNLFTEENFAFEHLLYAIEEGPVQTAFDKLAPCDPEEARDQVECQSCL